MAIVASRETHHAAQDKPGFRRTGLIGLSVVLIGIAATLVVRQVRGPALRDLPTKGYYYDLQTGELFVAEATAVPPIAGPSGAAGPDGRGSGVRAYVFSCGACDEKERYVGYLESTPPGTPAQPTQEQARALAGAGLIASPDAKNQWYLRTTREGQKIVAQAMTRCGGKLAVRCDPP